MGTEQNAEQTAAPTPSDPQWHRAPGLSAAVVAEARVSRSGLHSDGSLFSWSESRPDQGGRQVVVSDRAPGSPVDVTPRGTSVRSRVHEYGGAAAATFSDLHVFVDQADQRLYRLDPSANGDGTGVPLTPLAPEPGASRWADVDRLGSGDWLVGVEELVGAGPDRHRLVAVAVDGSLRTVPLVDQSDFVACPRVSPDGRHLAWVSWEHPSMPWDVSELWVALVTESEQGPILTGAHRLAGGKNGSVGQPKWCRNGDLLLIDERNGWWLPYSIASIDLDRPDPEATPLALVEAEFHSPDWVLGQATMVEWEDGSVVCRMHSEGSDHLVRLMPPGAGTPPPSRPGDDDAGGWRSELIDQPCVAIEGVAVATDSGRLAVLGSTPELGAAVYEVSVDGSLPPKLLSTSSPVLSSEEICRAQPYVADTSAGTVPGLFYLPTEVIGAPPLVVFCHGGPTAANDPGFDPLVQFFTSHGLAVAAVDYRGSSGYGRRYRRLLNGAWGVADVEDCVAYAVALADEGWVDGRRMAIRGTSSGGLTALGALVASDRFTGAAAWYGVTDLEALAADTHGFESHYLDTLVGVLPAAAEEFRRRSPIHHADSIAGGVLLLQGSEDPVVPLGQAMRFAEALEDHGVSHQLTVFEGESHGFRRAETIEASIEAEMAFYRALFDAPGDGWPKPSGHRRPEGTT